VHKIAELVSQLRHKHGLYVHARRFFSGGCGQHGQNVVAAVSPRVSVSRWSLSDFCSGANRAAVIGHCQTLNDLYERPCLLLEADAPDEDGSLPRSIHTPGSHRTKYVDALLARLSDCRLRVLFTSSQEESARYVAALARKEEKKGAAFTKERVVTLDDAEERIALPFYQVSRYELAFNDLFPSIEFPRRIFEPWPLLVQGIRLSDCLRMLFRSDQS